MILSIQQSPIPEMEMHIPEDLSLSKGVSERGINNQSNKN